jgi:hypothetical protein
MTKLISRDSWRTVDMPLTYETTSLNIKLTESEFQAVLIGFLPKDTDDRWFMYVNEGWINLHRSWTGHCIFRIKVEVMNEGWLLNGLQVNRDHNQYKSTNIEADKNEAESVLRYLIKKRITETINS